MENKKHQKITVCGSMAFSQEMINAKKELEKQGFAVILPEGVEEYIDGKWEKKLASGWNPAVEGAKRKIENNLIKKHHQAIKEADAILVINKDKNNIKNYIGGNTFLEIGFAFVLGKKILTLNDLPQEQTMIYQELVAMQPVILNGRLAKVAALF